MFKSIKNQFPTKLVYLILAIILISLPALTMLVSNRVYAATGTVYPDGDNVAQFTNSTGASHYTEIDEASYSAADYINTGLSGAGAEEEEYSMTSVAGAPNLISSIDVNIYAYADGACQSDCDSLEVRVSIDGAFDATTNTITLTGTDTEYTTSWTGNWTGDEDLVVEIIRVVNGTGNPNGRDDNVRIGRVSATVGYTAVPTQIAFTTTGRTQTAGVCGGAGNVITIQLQGSGGSPTNPTGSTTVTVSSSSGEATFYSDSSCSTQITGGDISFTTAENTKNFYVTDTEKSEPTHTLSATQSAGPNSLTSDTQSITINAGAASRLVIALPGETFTDGSGISGSTSNQTAGASFNITGISATDDYFNVNTTYSGAKTFAYSGPSNAPDTTSPSFTTSVNFTSGQSTTTLTTTLYNAESTTITVTDGGAYGYASSSLTVSTGLLDNFTVTSSSPTVAGTCQSTTGITARDAWNNSRTSDVSLVNMTSSGSNVIFYTNGSCGTPTSQYTLSSGTATFYFSSTDKQTGFTITATKDGDTQNGTTSSLGIDPAAANAILVELPGQSFADGTGITGSPSFTGTRAPNATAGTSFSVSLHAVDAYNNLVDTGTNNYNGLKTFDWSNSTAGNAPDTTSPNFPGSVSFSSGTASSLTVTYYNAATGRTIEADDTGTPVNGTTSSTFTVQAATADSYDVSATASQVAGVSFNVSVTAIDVYENQLGSLYAAPSGTYTWSATASNAPDSTAPAIGTLVQGDFSAGTATQTVTLYNAESGITFTAAEPGPSTVSGVSNSISVDPGDVSANINDSSITGGTTVQINSTYLVTITLLDTWENPVSGVASGNITVSATGSPSVTQPSAATDASGLTTADVSWPGTGSRTVSVNITSISLVQNDGTTADADGFLDDQLTVDVELPAGSSRIQGGATIQGGTTLQ